MLMQPWNVQGKVFEKVHEPLSAGRIGGIVILGGGQVVVTLMQKDPKKITAMSLKPKWEAFKYNDKLQVLMGDGSPNIRRILHRRNRVIIILTVFSIPVHSYGLVRACQKVSLGSAPG